MASAISRRVNALMVSPMPPEGGVVGFSSGASRLQDSAHIGFGDHAHIKHGAAESSRQFDVANFTVNHVKPYYAVAIHTTIVERIGSGGARGETVACSHAGDPQLADLCLDRLAGIVGGARCVCAVDDLSDTGCSTCEAIAVHDVTESVNVSRPAAFDTCSNHVAYLVDVLTL